jgi:drug/metabolite transporter (DMT)-like permease
MVGFLWGIPYLLIKVAVEEISPTLIVLSRVVIGSAILIPIAMMRGSLMPAIKAWRYVIPYAMGEMIGPWFLITAAEQDMSSGLAGLLVATVPIWATLISSLHGDKTVWQRKRLFGILICCSSISSSAGTATGMAVGELRLFAAVGGKSPPRPRFPL